MTEPIYTTAEKEDLAAERANMAAHRELVAARIAEFAGRGDSVHSPDHLLELLLAGFGGMDGYVIELLADFKKTKLGSHPRMRLHALIEKLLEFVAVRYGKENRFGNRTPDELVGRLKQILLEDRDGQAA